MFRKLMAARQAMLTTRNQSVRQFSAYAQHRNTEDNTEETPFEFTPESHAAIEQLLTKYPDNYKCSAVIPALFIAQKQNSNFLTLTAMHKVAKMLEMTPMQVYEGRLLLHHVQPDQARQVSPPGMRNHPLLAQRCPGHHPGSQRFLEHRGRRDERRWSVYFAGS